MLKVLHTADWHLGKRLQNQDLSSYQAAFLEWLVSYIQGHEIDVLLLSGDVFDLANPPSRARELYYQSLHQLSRTGVQMVITGGNHDSPAVLNAPRELLSTLGIHVFGRLRPDWSEHLVPLGPPAAPQAVVAAVPFLRDSELPHLAPGQNYPERAAALRAGLQEVYHHLAREAQHRYPGLPLLGMGHLYAAGAHTSASEREIQIGNQAAVSADIFPPAYQYLALGHIHRPQAAGAAHLRYAGSPVPLSFSERQDTKQVRVWAGGPNVPPQHQEVPLPAWIKLRRLQGTWPEVRQKLREMSSGEADTWIELIIQLEQPDPQLPAQVEEVVGHFNEQQGARVVKYRLDAGAQRGTESYFAAGTAVDELQPKDVFQSSLEQQSLPPEDHRLLTEAFEDLLQEYYQQADAS
jgi:exonuclease SbcD